MPAVALRNRLSGRRRADASDVPIEPDPILPFAHGLGRRADPQRLSDKTFCIYGAPGFDQETLPPYRFWPVPEILDQGASPECVGYAWSQWVASTDPPQPLAPEPSAIYRLSRQRDEFSPAEQRDGSTSVRGGALALEQLGYTREFRWAACMTTVLVWLLKAGPMVVGTDVYESWDEPPASGLVGLGGAVAGGHAWLLSGVDTESGLFLGTNSWGEGWGWNGQFWLTAQELETLLTDKGEAMVAVETAVGSDLDTHGWAQAALSQYPTGEPSGSQGAAPQFGRV